MSTLYPAGTDFRSTPDYKGGIHKAVNAALIPITSLIFGTRIYVRVFMMKNAGLDDGLALAAYVRLLYTHYFLVLTFV